VTLKGMASGWLGAFSGRSAGCHRQRGPDGQLWDAVSARIGILQGHARRCGPAFPRTAMVVTAAGSDRQVWSVRGKKAHPQKHGAGISSVAFLRMVGGLSPAAGSTAKVWEAASGKELLT